MKSLNGGLITSFRMDGIWRLGDLGKLPSFKASAAFDTKTMLN